MTSFKVTALKNALQWHLDAGADEVLAEEPIDRTKRPAAVEESMAPKKKSSPASSETRKAEPTPLGASEAHKEAVALAKSAKTLEELRNAIAGFEGISLKKTATNLVFSDGNPEAAVMVIGEPPDSEEDRQGIPFVGASGQLMDRILLSVGLDRKESQPSKAAYLTNIVNWRPPGNRNPTSAEVETSLPFLERHIALVQPKIILLCGGTPAKGLLNTRDGISRLRGQWHQYKPRNPELKSTPAIPALVTYHPSYLLQTPGQKRAVWADMLQLLDKRRELGLASD